MRSDWILIQNRLGYDGASQALWTKIMKCTNGKPTGQRVQIALTNDEYKLVWAAQALLARQRDGIAKGIFG